MTALGKLLGQQREGEENKKKTEKEIEQGKEGKKEKEGIERPKQTERKHRASTKRSEREVN